MPAFMVRCSVSSGQPRRACPVLGGAEGIDADALALLGGLLEADRAVDQGKERVITTHADVAAGLDDGAALAHEHGAGADDRAITALDAEPLALAIAAVARAANALLVCHMRRLLLFWCWGLTGLAGFGRRASLRCRGRQFFSSSRRLCHGWWRRAWRRAGFNPLRPQRIPVKQNVGDAQPRQVLAVASLAAVAHLGLVAEDDDLLAALVLDHLGAHHRARDARRPNPRLGA